MACRRYHQLSAQSHLGGGGGGLGGGGLGGFGGGGLGGGGRGDGGGGGGLHITSQAVYCSVVPQHHMQICPEMLHLTALEHRQPKLLHVSTGICIVCGLLAGLRL